MTTHFTEADYTLQRMDRTVARLITKLRSNELSRNRNFELFKTPQARRALRVHLLLQKLEEDLSAMARNSSANVALEDQGGTVVVRMEDTSLSLKRRVYLSRAELAILLQEPAIADLLRSPC